MFCLCEGVISGRCPVGSSCMHKTVHPDTGWGCAPGPCPAAIKQGNAVLEKCAHLTDAEAEAWRLTLMLTREETNVEED